MKVFISYRRKDSQGFADRIYDWLSREFGTNSVFKDIDSMLRGRDFRKSLEDALARCDVLLAVIGPHWLGETDAAGGRRVDDPGDWVRIEIETALTRNPPIPVIPLLVDGAPLPRGEDLPPSLQELVYRHGMPVRHDPDFSHDMGRLIRALQGPGSNAVKMADKPFHRTLTGHTDTVMSVAFAPDGSTLASGSGDKTVRLWRVSDGSPLRTLERSGAHGGVAFTPDGSTLAAGSGRIVQLWRVSDGSPLRTLEGRKYRVLSPGGIVWSVAFAPDGSTLAAGWTRKTWGDLDGIVQLWRVSDWSLLHTLDRHTNSVISVAFTPDGSTLASGSWDKTVRLWRVSDGSPLRTLEGHTDFVTSVAFAPDGSTLASGSSDGTVRLWRVPDGSPLRTLEGHTNSVVSVAFAPDGSTLASGSWDKTVRLWRVSDGSPLRTLEGHTNFVTSVAFAPDGSTLASGSYDSTVQLWRLT